MSRALTLILCCAALGVSCDTLHAPQPPTTITSHTETLPMTDPIPGEDALTREIATRVLATPTPQVQQLARALAADWRREAGDDHDLAPDVLAILREDLDEALDGRDAEGRLLVLECEVLERQLRGLSRDSLALGKQVIDGEIDDSKAKAQGERLLKAAEALSPQIRAIPDEALRAPLQRDLNDLTMEALYAVERKAMSRRLSDYAQTREGASEEVPPPNISP